MKVRLPEAAPPIPPETRGVQRANRQQPPRLQRRGHLSTSTVEQSQKTAPGAMAGITSAATARNMAPLGSMVITTSAPLAARAAVAAAVTPSGIGALRVKARNLMACTGKVGSGHWPAHITQPNKTDLHELLLKIEGF